MGIIHRSVPISSSLLVSADEAVHFFDASSLLPSNIRKMIFSTKTGAYVQGVTKAYDLPEESSPWIAFAILRIAVGDIPLANLGVTLSSELKVANDKAQKMAAELEHDLFAPVAGELGQYLAAKKQQRTASAGAAASQAGASNVLDLKNKPKPPVPPSIPRPLSNP